MDTNNLNDKEVSQDIFPEPKVLGVSASPRRKGNSDVLLKHILQGVREENRSAEKIHLREYYFQPCVGCEKCRKDKRCSGLNDGMQMIYPKIRESQGLVLISPTHNYNITAWMKAFIDRLYCFYNFDNHRPRGWSSRLAGQNRKAFIAAVCEQNDKKDMGFTLEAMRIPLEALGYEVIGELPVFGIFDRGGVRKHEKTLIRASDSGRELAKALTR
ncbi:flavodoxin family protein [Desulfonema magnum]|uniref:NADPH-dependent FMN reductase n=1 Tax=Desulfonema magnum TaxID=45655 RepID=A0A975BN61_9BACT|nr:flavodoxin family protein [Desulfonema magnum]QTA88322.1 NADPH-dependent FMN reductase [Desulfonema magnum]